MLLKLFCLRFFSLFISFSRMSFIFFKILFFGKLYETKWFKTRGNKCKRKANSIIVNKYLNEGIKSKLLTITTRDTHKNINRVIVEVF